MFRKVRILSYKYNDVLVKREHYYRSLLLGKFMNPVRSISAKKLEIITSSFHLMRNQCHGVRQ